MYPFVDIRPFFALPLTHMFKSCELEFVLFTRLNLFHFIFIITVVVGGGGGF